MKKLLLAVMTLVLVGMLFAESNSGKVPKANKFDAYFEMGSVTQATDRDLKKFAAIGPKEIGVVYGLNSEWAVGASWQLAIDTLDYPYAKDDYVGYKGPLSVFAQKPLGQFDVAGINDIDLKAAFSYDLLPLQINYDKKLIGGDGATEKQTNLKASIKASKEFQKGLTFGGSLFFVNTSYKDDPDNNLDLDYDTSNALGYTLGADYAINDMSCAYLTLTKTLDSSLVKRGTGVLKDESGSIVLGAQAKF